MRPRLGDDKQAGHLLLGGLTVDAPGGAAGSRMAGGGAGFAGRRTGGGSPLTRSTGSSGSAGGGATATRNADVRRRLSIP